MAELSKRESKLDVLINNAGATWGDSIDDHPVYAIMNFPNFTDHSLGQCVEQSFDLESTTRIHLDTESVTFAPRVSRGWWKDKELFH